MSREYAAAVVGARVAGASTALLLARAGLRVALVDQSRYGSDTVSTHALVRAGVMQLSRWGLLDRIVSAGTPAISSAQFHYGDGNIVRVAILPRAGVKALYAPRRYLLDRFLVDIAQEAGAHVLHETTVTTLRRDMNGRVRGVSAMTRDGRMMHLSARMTVGADGTPHRRQIGRRARPPAGSTCLGGPLSLPHRTAHRRLRMGLRARRRRRADTNQ